MICLVLVLALTSLPAVLHAAWPSSPARLSLPVERIAGPNRFATAAAAAGSAYPGWVGVEHVVVVSGDDRAQTDPLAASGLCWAYDAPLLLTSSRSTPKETRAALSAIVSANTTVTVHVVGGPVAVPAKRVTELRAIVGPAGTVQQPWVTGDRYSLAAGIAERMRTVAVETSRTPPSAAFIANGAEAERLSDALAVSAVARNTGVPVLLTAAGSVPVPTARALSKLAPADRIVIGGPHAVGDNVYRSLKADRRWSGSNRYSTATHVASQAIKRGWSKGHRAGLASAVPDALAGAAALGRSGGVVLVTAEDRLPKETWSWLLSSAGSITKLSVLGGTQSVHGVQYNELRGAPGRPVINKGTPETLVGSKMRVAGRVNSNATSVELLVGGKRVSTRSVTPYGAYDFGWVDSPSRSGSIEVKASNPDGKTCSATRRVERLIYPYATCIIVDKSEFKLYWIKDNRLVKTYPVAVGRTNAETPATTWKILSKYHSDPGGIYGPRKMRLYRKTASGYTYTRYLIHGTNNPLSIGTKASAGCIRMNNSDVLELFPQVPVGTMVITRE